MLFKFLILAVILFTTACQTVPQFDKKKSKSVIGAIVFGPEKTAFHPCADRLNPLWLIQNDKTNTVLEPALKIIASQPFCDITTMPCSNQVAWVMGNAMVLNPDGGSGHMGAYAGTIEFLTLEESSAEILCDAD